jgi:predicted metallo-beta-lactamase superfamily hydrolase
LLLRAYILNITPLAFESFGVRSMCTFIETNNLKIIIDPAVSLAPKRYDLPPHRIEEKMKSKLGSEILKKSLESDLIVVTHFHYDHIDPDKPEIYEGKTLLLKNPNKMINPSQKKRANKFIKKIKGMVEHLEYADNRTFRFDDTQICFSNPVPHGSTTQRGYVIEVCITDDESFIHSSDINGPILFEHLEFILENEPSILFVDGPTTYIKNEHMDIELKKANQNLMTIINKLELEKLVIDHHLLRDLDYKTHLQQVYEFGEETGFKICSAIEFLNMEPNLLEAKRRELYMKDEF